MRERSNKTVNHDRKHGFKTWSDNNLNVDFNFGKFELLKWIIFTIPVNTCVVFRFHDCIGLLITDCCQ